MPDSACAVFGLQPLRSCLFCLVIYSDWSSLCDQLCDQLTGNDTTEHVTYLGFKGYQARGFGILLFFLIHSKNSEHCFA